MRPTLQRWLGAARGAGRYVASNLTRENRDLLAAARIGISAGNPTTPRPRWEEAKQRVLFFAPRSWSIHQAWEGTLAHGLEQRGAATRFLYCAQAMPLCDSHLVETLSDAEKVCDNCAGKLPTFLTALGHTPVRATRFVRPREVPAARIDALATPAEIRSFRFAGLPLGEWIEPSLLRFFRSGSLEGSERELRVARAFLKGAVAMQISVERALERWRPTHVVLLNGKFYAEKVAFELARARNIRVITYERGFIVDTLIFDRDRSVNDYILSRESLDEALERELTGTEDARLDEYLSARTRGARSIVQYWPELVERPEEIRQELSIEDGVPLTVLFPNILWDTAILGKDIHFESMFDWIGTTIEWFTDHPDQHLVIRCHPAEVQLPKQSSRQRVEAWLEQTYAKLPSNVKVVSSSSPLSSYVIADWAQRVLVYTSTLGLEMALRGQEVVVSGETHYRGKGFTFEPESKAHYAELLGRPPAQLDDEKVARARRYANLLFFRFMLPFDLVTEPERSTLRFGYERVSELAPGNDAVLDVVCKGILKNTPFLLPPAQS